MEVEPSGTEVVVERPDEAVPDFDAWVAARSSSLMRFAYLVTGSQSAAEDALQSALTSACERWSRIGAVDDPDAYVRRMVANAHVSWWRRVRRRESPLAEVAPAGQVDDPAEAVSREDVVWRLCRTLPARQRACVVLRFYDDLSYAEIARLLDCAEATARSSVHRALAAMRSQIEELDHG